MKTVMTLGFIPKAGDSPAMVVNEVVRLDRCECIVCFGTRDDNQEFAMAAIPCPDVGHKTEMEEFVSKFRLTLDDPQDVPATLVAMQVLTGMGVS